MYKKSLKLILICIFVNICTSVFAQTHISVPLENRIYQILEKAAIRGLCSTLSGVRPYTQNVVVKAINEILGSELKGKNALNDKEREILKDYLAKFSKPKKGMDFYRGGFYAERGMGKNDIPLSINIDLSVDIEGSAGIYLPKENYFGTETWLNLSLNGDISRYFSWRFSVEGGVVSAPRKSLGFYHTYYEGFNDVSSYQDQRIEIFSQPLTHFPYAYKKRWDGSIFAFDDLASLNYWPNSIAGAYGIMSELTASFIEDKLILRAGRISHDWGAVPMGSSLAFNQMARPFAALEAEFNPVSWFGISSLTGILEYENRKGEKVSSSTFQNAFSVTMFQFRIKEYVFFDFIDSVVWPKRFEIGYMLPIFNNFFYQNNVGDFDNLAMTFNLRAQYPGIGSIWASFFMDEMNFTNDLKTLDRQMFAWQAGANFPLPILAFSSVKFSYTKINPYCYTHNRNYNPWYGDLTMETSYTNNGAGLGYYLPPNSDEILFQFQTMPIKNINLILQYQMIRHGANFGPSAVDGSDLLSELDPNGRNEKDVLKRFFLKDGAYRWMHIVKVGVDWALSKAPLSFYTEAGVNYSYFTNIEGEANSGKASPYKIIDTSVYPKTTGFIFSLGVKIYPRW